MVNEFCGFKHGVIGTDKMPADTTLNNMKEADLKGRCDMERYDISVVENATKTVNIMPETHYEKVVADCMTDYLEYRKAEEDGLLKMLPVAIGSDVYFIPSKADYDLNNLCKHGGLNRVYHQKVARIVFTECGWHIECSLNLQYGITNLLRDKSYKETWFTTEAEAEQALAKMKGE